MHFTDAGDRADFILIARRNTSLSSSGRQFVFLFLLVVCFGIAITFAAFGAWLILPFAGIEMLVLYLAFRYVDRHATDYESLTIDADRVLLESHTSDRVDRAEFNRHWAQVVLQQGRSRCRLVLRSHGRETEFGRHMTDRQRIELAGTLRERLGIRHGVFGKSSGEA